jgi:competence protein ComEA
LQAGQEAPEATGPPPLRVYITGEVRTPDVYSLPPGSIVQDLVIAAGGTRPGADLEAVNMALPLSDGMHVHIPAEGESSAIPPVTSGGGAAGGLVNINTATAEELKLLPGIGDVTAAAIIGYRQANGPFDSIEAIMDVPGIGEGKFEQIRLLITTGG